MKKYFFLIFLFFSKIAFGESQVVESAQWLEYLAPFNWGVGISANWNAFVGYGFGVEYLFFGSTERVAAIYCAPVGVAATDTNLGAAINIVKPMGYSKPEDYTGYAFSISLGLPFKIGAVQYSWGGNFNEAIDNLEKQKKYGDFDPSQIREEIVNFLIAQTSSEIAAQQKAQIKTIMCQVGSLAGKNVIPQTCYQGSTDVQFTTKTFPKSIKPGDDQAKKLDEWVTADYTAMFKMLKAMSEKNVFAELAPNFNKFYRAVVNSVADCGSITISIGLGAQLSLFPGSISLQLSHFTLVAKSSSISKRFQNAISLNPIKMASNYFEDANGISSLVKQLAQACPESRRILGTDINRFTTLMFDEPDIPKLDIPIEQYFIRP